MAVNQEAADALNQEVKDLVKELQQKNADLEKQVESLSEYNQELLQEISDMHDREYEV